MSKIVMFLKNTVTISKANFFAVAYFELLKLEY